METYTFNGKTIPETLRILGAKGNQAFTASLHPGVKNVLGCRMADLRRLAKAIARDKWQCYLANAGTHYMEERTLHGLVLGYIQPTDFQAYLQFVDSFVASINSWSVCDAFSFAGGREYLAGHRTELWRYLQGKMQEKEPYAIRFGVVMSMRYFLDEEHLAALFRLYDTIRDTHYYVRMAVAWAVAECYIHFPETTTAYLQNKTLDATTQGYTLRKIRESLRVDKAAKENLRQLLQDEMHKRC